MNHSIRSTNFYEGRTRLEFEHPVDPGQVYKGYHISWNGYMWQGVTEDYDGWEDHTNLVTGNTVLEVIDEIDEITSL